MHTEGRPEVQDLATIRVLEGIQNPCAANGRDPGRFLTYLGPESGRLSVALNNLWSGKSPTVQAGDEPSVEPLHGVGKVGLVIVTVAITVLKLCSFSRYRAVRGRDCRFTPAAGNS